MNDDVSPRDPLITMLDRTPTLLDALLRGLPESVLRAHDPDGWSAHEVVAHLLYNEQVNWMPRLERILEHGEERPFDPFDQAGHQMLLGERDSATLLDEFAARRAANLVRLRGMGLTDIDLARTGQHPALGRVTIGQLLGSWRAHDLNHLRQIIESLAIAHREEVGPWRRFLAVLDPG